MKQSLTFSIDFSMVSDLPSSLKFRTSYWSSKPMTREIGARSTIFVHLPSGGRTLHCMSGMKVVQGYHLVTYCITRCYRSKSAR